MKTIKDLPDWSDARARVQLGEGTALDRFIVDNEPAGAGEETEFRDGLLAVLEEAARAAHEPSDVPSSIVRAGDAFAATFKREPKAPSDSAWMNGYEAALRAAQPPPDDHTMLLRELDTYLSRSPAEVIHADSIFHRMIKNALGAPPTKLSAPVVCGECGWEVTQGSHDSDCSQRAGKET
jgi:hypothetical protein